MTPFICNVRATVSLGSACVSHVGDGFLAIADFSFNSPHTPSDPFTVKVRFGGTPKPTREARTLPNLLN